MKILYKGISTGLVHIISETEVVRLKCQMYRRPKGGYTRADADILKCLLDVSENFEQYTLCPNCFDFTGWIIINKAKYELANS
jgi:hypothetical protein